MINRYGIVFDLDGWEIIRGLSQHVIARFTPATTRLRHELQLVVDELNKLQNDIDALALYES